MHSPAGSRPSAPASTAVGLTLAALFVVPGSAAAQEPTPPTPPKVESAADDRFSVYDRIMVIGSPGRIDEIPGSAHHLGGAQLQQAKVGFDDIHTILARIPGVNIQEEEGYGLRPNIGLRGSGSERSARITLMEDGVLIAPAPYAAPAAYYFPTAGRMESIEVRKGSSQVKFGPRTTGGALNLVSTRVPDGPTARVNLAAGADATIKGHLAVGDTSGRFGWLLETYQLRTDGFKRVDGGGEAGTTLQDYMAKVRFRSAPEASRFQELEIKLGHTTQDSNETYLGLTQADFEVDPLRRYAGSQHDNLTSRHRQVQARHFVTLSSTVDLTTVVYRNDFERDWYKTQSVNGVGIGDVLATPEEFANELAILRGATSTADSIVQRHNDRTYFSHGAQIVLGARLNTGAVRHDVEIGGGFHADQEDRFQSEDGYRMLDGRKLLTSVGAPGSQANRVADARAWKLFAHDRMQVGRLGVTPGIRFEHIRLERRDYAAGDAARATPTRSRDKTLDVMVAGIGLDYALGAGTSAFAGVHRGFAPPGPGAAGPVEPETSVNYEMGLRHRGRAGAVQVAAFLNDYENLLGRDTLASGGTGSGDQFNGGAARIHGVEVGASTDLGRWFGWRRTNLPVSAAYTWTRGRFESDFESEFDPWGVVRRGDELPYLAPHQLFTTAGIRRSQWEAIVDLRLSSAMRTHAGAGPLLATASTDTHAVVGLSGSVGLGERVRLHASVQNLFDSSYVVARRPAGVRPGLPRTALIGLRFTR